MPQVALKAMQKHHRNAALNDTDKEEIARLKGALQQSCEDYTHLLEQFSRFKAGSAALSSRTQQYKEDVCKLQTANAALSQQLQQSQEQLQQSQKQLRSQGKEADKAQKLLEQLSKAAADIHSAADRCVDQPSSVDAAKGFSARHNLQAVHSAVQSRMAAYGSKRPESEDNSDVLILPALWKPQKERYLAPTGF